VGVAERTEDHRGLIAKALAELRRTGPGDPGLTANEIAEKVGMDVKRVRDWIREEIAAGRVTQGWRPMKGIDGRNTRTPVYAVKK
jgi:hypothetical protein